MYNEDSRADFNSQEYYLGIDVHKKNWTVTIRSSGIVIKTFSMDPSPDKLIEYMKKHYPGGKYNSVYEAGFTGYWIHRQLEANGFNNIIAAPTEIPTSQKEKEKKRDSVDSRKLSRELENGSLEGIYIPSQLNQEIRSLTRLRDQIIKSQSRLKNQIKSYLDYYGKELPENYQLRHWSRSFIEHLRNLDFEYPVGKTQLEIYLDELIEKRRQKVRVVREIRKYLKEYNLWKIIDLLRSVPGIGFTTAVTLYGELENIVRFKSFDHLASYVGLIPSIQSSSEKELVLGIKRRHNRQIRQLLVEAAWVAVRNDPVLTCAYSNYQKRMSKQEAIIRIAKKLLSRILYVWRTGNGSVKSFV